MRARHVLLVPPALAGIALSVWNCRVQHAEPPAAPIGAPASIAPAVDLGAALVAIGKAHVALVPPPPPAEGLIFSASPACARPDAAAIAATTRQISAWLDQRHADEVPSQDYPMQLAMGCTDPQSHAIVVGVVAERALRTPAPHAFAPHRTYVLRVAPAGIVAIAETASESSELAMEWSDEGFVEPVALADIDGDGREDVVFAGVSHEGGAVTMEVGLEVVLSSAPAAASAPGSASGYARIATAHALGAFWGKVVPSAVSGRLVLALEIARTGFERVALDGPDGATVYACVAAAGTALERCAASDAAAQAGPADAIAERLANGAGASQDRDTLADELAALHVPAAEAVPLVAAARPPTPREHADRAIAALVAGALPPIDRIADALDASRVHPEARAYFERIEAALGDRACPVPPASAALRARALGWVRTREPKTAPDAVEIAPACGPYLWVAWTDRDTRAHDTLLGTGAAPIVDRVADVMPEEMGGRPAHPASAFVLGAGGVPVGWVDLDGERLAIANDNIVARGAFASYAYRAPWDDIARDLVVDDKARAFHVTPAGFVAVAPAELVAHDARIAAVAALDHFAAKTHEDIAYARADILRGLATLHADPEVVAIVTAL